MFHYLGIDIGKFSHSLCLVNSNNKKKIFQINNDKKGFDELSQKLAKINKKMKKGDILIAETTSPDVMVLVNKAAAIVAEQGGLLSHAAVVSREFKIPCVIQAEGATRIFKDGDLVEVDAENGIVKRV